MDSITYPKEQNKSKSLLQLASLPSFRSKISVLFRCPAPRKRLKNEPDPTDVFRKDPQKPSKQSFFFKLPTTAANCEEETATSTTSIIHQGKALVKSKNWALLPESCHQNLIYATRSTEILVPNKAYRVRTDAKYFRAV